MRYLYRVTVEIRGWENVPPFGGSSVISGTNRGAGVESNQR